MYEYQQNSEEEKQNLLLPENPSTSINELKDENNVTDQAEN